MNALESWSGGKLEWLMLHWGGEMTMRALKSAGNKNKYFKFYRIMPFDSFRRYATDSQCRLKSTEKKFYRFFLLSGAYRTRPITHKSQHIFLDGIFSPLVGFLFCFAARNFPHLFSACSRQASPLKTSTFFAPLISLPHNRGNFVHRMLL